MSGKHWRTSQKRGYVAAQTRRRGNETEENVARAMEPTTNQQLEAPVLLVRRPETPPMIWPLPGVPPQDGRVVSQPITAGTGPSLAPTILALPGSSTQCDQDASHSMTPGSGRNSLAVHLRQPPGSSMNVEQSAIPQMPRQGAVPCRPDAEIPPVGPNIGVPPFSNGPLFLAPLVQPGQGELPMHWPLLGLNPGPSIPYQCGAVHPQRTGQISAEIIPPQPQQFPAPAAQPREEELPIYWPLPGSNPRTSSHHYYGGVIQAQSSGHARGQEQHLPPTVDVGIAGAVSSWRMSWDGNQPSSALAGGPLPWQQPAALPQQPAQHTPATDGKKVSLSDCLNEKENCQNLSRSWKEAFRISLLLDFPHIMLSC